MVVHLCVLGSARLKELAASVGESTSAAGRHVSWMAQRGIVEGEPPNRSGTAVVRLTALARALLPARDAEVESILLAADPGTPPRWSGLWNSVRREELDSEAALMAWLGRNGYVGLVEKLTADTTLVMISSCPFRNVVRKQPGLCASEQRALAELTGCSVRQRAQMSAGDSHCDFMLVSRHEGPQPGCTQEHAPGPGDPGGEALRTRVLDGN